MTNRFTSVTENKNVYMREWRRKRKKLRVLAEKLAAPRVHSDVREAESNVRNNRRASDLLLVRLHKFHGNRISAPRGEKPADTRVAPPRPDTSAGTIPGGQG